MGILCPSGNKGFPTLRHYTLAVLLLLGMVVWYQPAWAQRTEPEDFYTERGTVTCLKCHDKPPSTLILHSAHAVQGDKRTPFAKQGCEGCHGPSALHSNSKPQPGQKRPPPSVIFSGPDASPVAMRNGVCSECHSGGSVLQWQGSPHHANDVACVSCHAMHGERDTMKQREKQPEICFGCHAEQRAQTLRASHHPIREGKVGCSDCHNPHGSATPFMLVKNRLNDTCYECHAEKRGPFLWEHAPVREDCSLCHTPHGSSQSALLKERAPWLCQSCHDSGQHPTRLYGANTPARQSLARGCLNCHSQVHGSNHPSGNFNLR